MYTENHIICEITLLTLIQFRPNTSFGTESNAERRNHKRWQTWESNLLAGLNTLLKVDWYLKETNLPVFVM